MNLQNEPSLPSCDPFPYVIGCAAVLLTLVFTSLISCDVGYDRGIDDANVQWERAIIEKGFGTYETVHTREHTKFKFKEQKNGTKE